MKIKVIKHNQYLLLVSENDEAIGMQTKLSISEITSNLDEPLSKVKVTVEFIMDIENLEIR